MAKPSGVSSAAHPRRSQRSQSEQPQAIAPSRNTRSTRSRTGSEQPPERNNPKRRGGKAAAASPEPAHIVQALPTLDEDAGLSEEDVDVETHIAEQLQAGRRSPRRSSAMSAISGTTAKTSFSHEEIELLDPDVMVDVLPDLDSSSDHLAQLLAPNGARTQPELWKEIKRTGSRSNKIYNHRWASLGIHRSSFATREYIRPDNVLRALFSVESVDELPHASWRPDEILYKFNLTQMLNCVLITCNQHEWTPSATDALERLETAFPSGISGVRGRFSLSALHFWLQIAAQVAIRRLEAAIGSDPNLAPDKEIDNVFFLEDGVFKHAEALGFNALDEDQLDQAHELLRDLITILKEPFESPSPDPSNGNDPTAALGQLKTRYLWDNFQDNMLTYYEARKTEIDRLMQAAGGISAIKDKLAQEIEARQEQKTEERIRNSLKKTSVPRASLGGRNSIAALKEREKQVGAPVAQMAMPPAQDEDDIPDVEQPADTVVQDFGSNHQSSEPPKQGRRQSSTIVEPAVPPRSQTVTAAMDIQAKMGKGKGRFIDRQADAVCIDHDMNIDDESQSSQTRVVEQYGNFRPAAFATTSAKRTHTQMDEEPEDFDPTQDEGFQNDDRDHSRADQLRREVSFQQPSRQRSATALRSSPGFAPEPSVAHGSPASRPSPRKRQRQNPGSAIPPPSRLGPDDIEPNLYARAKNDAKFNRVKVKSTQDKLPQSRTPWTNDEEARLIDLIRDECDDGISYSKLKAIDDEDGGVLALRRAEDLRFKARNMLETMLKAGVRVPANWDKVVLDKKAIEKLHARGIPYERQRIRAPRTLDE